MKEHGRTTDRRRKAASLLVWVVAAAAGAWYFHSLSIVTSGRGDGPLLMPGMLAGGGAILALYLWADT